jgi:diguanylate cyclase (GGDEF)-like protein
MSKRVWMVYLAGGLISVASYLLLPLEGLWSSLAYDLIGLSSATAILVAVRRHQPARPLIWWCFAIGQLLFVVGDVLYAVIDTVLHQSPYPSVADGFYLPGYPVLAMGLLILIRGRISGRDRAGLIDAAIIATGLGLLSWTFLMKPIAADPSLSLLERLISLAYPLGDVLLLAMVARLATSPGARTIAYRLLGVALVVLRMAGLVAQVQDQAAQLAALAHNDGLTGIPNRRADELELPRERARVRRYGGHLHVALLDLDHFKRYNDCHGHQGGDRLLKEATAAWRTRTRSTDLLARYGGEEFAVLLRDCSPAQAVEVLCDLRTVTPAARPSRPAWLNGTAKKARSGWSAEPTGRC